MRILDIANETFRISMGVVAGLVGAVLGLALTALFIIASSILIMAIVSIILP